MPENMYKRDKIWWLRTQINGREHRESLRTSSEVKAIKNRDVRLEELSHGQFYGEERQKWMSVVTEWSTHAAENISPNTLKRYKVSIRSLRTIPIPSLKKRTLDDLYIDEINGKALTGLVKARRDAVVTNATIRRDLTAISSVLQYAEDQGWITDNHAHIFSRRGIKEKRDPITLPNAHSIDLVLRQASPMFTKLIQFAQQTGMRQEEIASLEHTQFRAKGAIVDLLKTKTNTPRSIELSDSAVGTIVGTPRHIKSKFVFWHGETGDRYAHVATNFRDMVRKAGKVAAKKGLDFQAFRFHDLRHLYAVEFLRGGGNIYRLQQDLGHASIRMTEEYLKYLTPEEAHIAKYGLAQK